MIDTGESDLEVLGVLATGDRDAAGLGRDDNPAPDGDALAAAPELALEGAGDFDLRADELGVDEGTDEAISAFH